MKRWRRIALIAGLLLVLTAGGLYEASTHVVRGWLRGEAFFEGRPTSWWSYELGLWEVRRSRARVPLPPVQAHLPRLLDVIPEQQFEDHFTYSRARNWTDKYREYWRSPEAIIEADFVEMCNFFNGPSVLNGGKDAEPVLRQLLDDPSEHVRRFARIGLKMESEIPVETD